MEKPFSCSICHKAFAKLNFLGDHVENFHILQKSSEKSHENHLDPKNSIKRSIVDQSKTDIRKLNQSVLNCEEINLADSVGDHVENVHIHKKSSKNNENCSDPKNIENFVVDQSEFDSEKIQNHSDPNNIEYSIVDKSEPDCEKIKNHSDRERIENSIVDQSGSDCVETQNQVEILIKDYPEDLKDHLRETFAKLNSLGDHVETVHILKKSENSQKNHSDPKNIETSIVDQSGDHVETVHILQTLSKNTHENHSDPKINQNILEFDCEKIQIQNLADKESKTSQGNHSDSKNTKESFCDQSESNYEEIQIQNQSDNHKKSENSHETHSNSNIIENSVVDQSESDCEENQIQNQADREEDEVTEQDISNNR